MKKFYFLLFFQLSFSQGYTEYLTGNATDLVVTPESGICLMGGASENDNAMIWFLNKANGGDVVVLRASGSNGYNDYFYSQLGVTLNSVRTFVINDAVGAIDPYVLDKIAKAEAIWFAGGDQFNYVNYFKDNAMESALNAFINTKQGVIGGTSAGMAIMGHGYFSAENGTVTNAQALSDPYHTRMTLGYNDFLDIPYMENLITDTHYDDPDRRARHSAFLARYATGNNSRAFGIACNEYTAVCVDSDGKAYVYGEYPTYDEFAFFVQSNCTSEYLPENCTSGSLLNWSRNNEAIKVYKVPGTSLGQNYFDLSDWQSGIGGDWESWYINNGVFFNAPTTNPNCESALSTVANELDLITIYPNPFSERISISANIENAQLLLFDLNGKQIKVLSDIASMDLSELNPGMYFLKVTTSNSSQTIKLIKE